MPYISLYRKYRSQSFDDVIGQDHVVKTIKNAIRAGRIGQGYLFCGSRGTGKTTVARLVAKALNCLESPGPTPEPCNKCEACVSITNGSAVDVIEIDAASNRGIDDIRAITENIRYSPMRLRYKVYIIDEAHQVTREAKDAFLKTLEEPPPHAVFILATTEAGKIPITIRSRCQQFDFRRGTVAEITSRLRHVISNEGVTIDEDAIDLIARTAAGSYRDSLSVLEQVMAYTDGTIAAKDVNTVIGAVDEDVLLELGDVVASGDTSAAFDLADRLLREGGDVRELLRSASNHFRDLLALKVGADSHHSQDPRWRAQSDAYSQERLVQAIEVFSAAEKELKWNEQHRLGLEMALLKAMARPREREAPAERRREVEAPAEPVAAPGGPRVAAPPRDEDRSGGAPSRQVSDTPREAEAPAEPAALPPDHDPYADKKPSPAPAEEPANVPAQPLTLGEIQRNWEKVLIHLRKVMRGASEAAAAKEGNPVDLRGSLLTIGFSEKFKFHAERTQQNAEKIAEAIQGVMGVRLKVNATVLGVQKAADDAPEAAAEASKEPLAPEHPQKDKVMTMFDGREVDPGPDPWS